MFIHFKRDVQHALVHDMPFEQRLPSQMGSGTSTVLGGYGYKLGDSVYFERVHAGDFVNLHKMDIYNRSLFNKE